MTNEDNKNQGILKWLFQKDGQIYSKILPLISFFFYVLTFLVNKFYPDSFNLTPYKSNLLFMLFNIIILLFALFTNVKIIGYKNQSPSNKPLQQQFKSTIQWFWLLSLCLYVFLAFDTYMTFKNTKDSELAKCLKNIKNETYSIDTVQKNLIRMNISFMGDSLEKVTDSNLNVIRKDVYIILDSINYIPQHPNLLKGYLPGLYTASHNLLEISPVYSEKISSILPKYLGRPLKIKTIPQKNDAAIKDSLITINDSLIINHNNDAITHFYDKNIFQFYKSSFKIHEEVQSISSNFNFEYIIWIKFFEALVSNLSSIFLFIGFIILYPYNNRGNYTTHNGKENLITFLNIITLKHSISKEGKGAIHAIRIWCSIVIVLTLIQFVLTLIGGGFPRQLDDAEMTYKLYFGGEFFLTLFSGILNAIAMSLLVARFESSHMSSPLIVIIILILYANIQSFFGLLGFTVSSYAAVLDNIVYIFAAFGKMTLFLYVLWIYSTGKFYKYLESKLNEEKEITA